MIARPGPEEERARAREGLRRGTRRGMHACAGDMCRGEGPLSEARLPRRELHSGPQVAPARERGPEPVERGEGEGVRPQEGGDRQVVGCCACARRDEPGRGETEQAHDAWPAAGEGVGVGSEPEGVGPALGGD